LDWHYQNNHVMRSFRGYVTFASATTIDSFTVNPSACVMAGSMEFRSSLESESQFLDVQRDNKTNPVVSRFRDGGSGGRYDATDTIFVHLGIRAVLALDVFDLCRRQFPILRLHPSLDFLDRTERQGVAKH
jgi:hypothetical protein